MSADPIIVYVNGKRVLCTSEAERLVWRDFPDEDHAECNHAAGHCQYSEMFKALFKAERQRQYEAKKNETCDECGKKHHDIRATADGLGLCFFCRKARQPRQGTHRRCDGCGKGRCLTLTANNLWLCFSCREERRRLYRLGQKFIPKFPKKSNPKKSNKKE